MTKEDRIYESRKIALTLFHASDFVISSSLDIRHSDSVTFVMHPDLRALFKADFTPEKYGVLLRCVNETEKWPADCRISETPIFLTDEFTNEVTRAANAIVDLTRTPEFAQHARAAIPKGLDVPNESAHPNFLIIDFGICAEGERLVPRLIELQAFPSLFGFQLLLLHCMRKA